MSNKQLITVIIVCSVVIVTGLSGVLSAFILNKTASESLQETSDIFSDLFSVKDTITLPENDYIGQINIVDVIQGSSNDSVSYINGGNEYNHNLYLSYIDQMMEDDYNKGIFLYVDSPGGTVYHSDEMYLKLLEYKEATGRPIYAYFAQQAASGAYYISMAADKIFMNRNSWTGSIGVIISMYNYSQLMEKIGVKEIDITSGENKTIGSPTQEMTDEQYAIMQSLVDESYEQFTDIVSKGRNMPVNKVKELADGRLYSAKQAYNNGLVDEIASYEDTVLIIKEESDCEEIFTPDTGNSILSFAKYFKSYFKNNSDSDIKAAMDMMENDNNGVLMYYAK